MKKTVLIYGGISGAIVFSYSLIYFGQLGDFTELSRSESKTAEIVGFLRYAILLVGILLGLRAFTKGRSGQTKYWSIVKTGAMIGLVCAAFEGAMEFTYMQFVNPDFMEQYAEITLKHAEEDGASPEKIAKIEASIEKNKMFENPIVAAVFYFMSSSVLGLVIALLAALFYRRKTKNNTQSS